jgi:hypothetical protein
LEVCISPGSELCIQGWWYILLDSYTLDLFLFLSQNLYKELLQNCFFRCSLKPFHKLELVRKLEKV